MNSFCLSISLCIFEKLFKTLLICHHCLKRTLNELHSIKKMVKKMLETFVFHNKDLTSLSIYFVKSNPDRIEYRYIGNDGA